MMIKNIIFILGLLFFSCENLVTDLPATKTTDYISGNVVTFPAKTRAIDIYNTIVTIFPQSEHDYDVTNGSWQRIKETNEDELLNQEWETITFTKIKHTHKKGANLVNTHTVYLYDDDELTREIIFRWQRQTTNVWKNEAIEGKITFTFAP